MKILVACEESQRVCMEMRKLGHEAYSCDIQEPSGGHPEWHILDDVLKYINGGSCFRTMDGTLHYFSISDKWDMIIAHPPCTYLSNAGARHLYKGGMLDQERFEKGLQAKQFFMQFYNADCKKICIENPVPSRVYELPQYSQIVHPCDFGHPYTKRTCLWLKGLRLLRPTNIIPRDECQSTKKAGNWFNKGGKDRQKNRSKTFPGVAKAMADQWAGQLL